MPNRKTVNLPMERLLAPISAIDTAARTVEVVWLSGERIKRYDWMSGQYFYLEFSREPGAARMGRLQSGTAPVLNAHSTWSLADQIGVVEKAAYGGGRGSATLRFSAREDVQPIFQDVQDKIIRNVSAGMNIYRYEQLPPDAQSEGLAIRRAVDFEPAEISLVPIGADAGAGTLADQSQRTHPCDIIDLSADPAQPLKENVMTTEVERAAAAAAETARLAEQAQRQQQTDTATLAATNAERKRTKDIRELCTLHKLDAKFEADVIDKGTPIEDVRTQILAKLAADSAAHPTRSGFDIEVVGDAGAQRRTNMAAAMFHRIAPTTELPDAAREYRYMSLLRMAEECVRTEGHSTRGLSGLEITNLAMQATSDFPNILAEITNKRLRQVYTENVPTYTQWARRAPNAPDFKNINVMQLSAAPDLEKVAAGGEFKYGFMTDGKTSYAVITYGKVLSFTRQAIINDDLRAFDRVPAAFAGSGRRLENRLVYAQLTGQPVMGEDNKTLFHTDHANEAAHAVISLSSLAAGRKLMREQVGLKDEELNLAPAFLITGPTNEQTAYQYTSAQYAPMVASEVNEFRTGGRTALTPVVDAVVSDAAWYLAANAPDVDTIEYCYLDGSEGVYLETRMGFTVDGVDVKARLDFAAKAIDFRGLFRNKAS
jgi:hypothetical protein